MARDAARRCAWDGDYGHRNPDTGRRAAPGAVISVRSFGQGTLDTFDRFHHPGFSAYAGEGVSAGDSAARERLSYLVHPVFSLARLHYDRDAGLVTYDPRAPSRSRPSPPSQVRFSPLDDLRPDLLHPRKGQQTVRYYGYYSNKARGQRRKRQQYPATVAAVPLPETESDGFRRHARRAWARLIRKV